MSSILFSVSSLFSVSIFPFGDMFNLQTSTDAPDEHPCSVLRISRICLILNVFHTRTEFGLKWVPEPAAALTAAASGSGGG